MESSTVIQYSHNITGSCSTHLLPTLVKRFLNMSKIVLWATLIAHCLVGDMGQKSYILSKSRIKSCDHFSVKLLAIIRYDIVQETK